MDRYLNIGLLIDDPNNYFTSQACKGADLAAKALDANLFIFPGHYIGEPDGRFSDSEYEYQYNTDRGLPLEDSRIVYGDFTEKSHAAVEKLLSLKGLTMINSYRDREDRVFRMVNNQMVNELNVADISMVSLVAHQLSVTVRFLI